MRASSAHVRHQRVAALRHAERLGLGVAGPPEPRPGASGPSSTDGQRRRPLHAANGTRSDEARTRAGETDRRGRCAGAHGGNPAHGRPAGGPGGWLLDQLRGRVQPQQRGASRAGAERLPAGGASQPPAACPSGTPRQPSSPEVSDQQEVATASLSSWLAALHSPLSVDPLEEQLRQSLDELRAKRLVVLDEVLPPEALCKVKLELQRMRQEQVLQNDTNDVCNPLQEAKYLPFADDATQFRESCPVTMQVMQRLAALASILEEELGLQLAVPKSAMAACYPPKASYKMHLDSYFLHGCPDDIPRKVTILLYCNQGWTKSVGGELRAWEAFDQGRGPSRTIEPLTGRMVVFMAEEIWHEVLESHGDRYALTLWIHDRARVQISP
ncbi:unnamed protein product [Durusdinium trenchii]|uniref:Fe2OG dioxygenase domain-containing protein n=1 Tax=Durusdinium trenchii TaxID=1381693 RepID=A0ABP0HB50_9DINO